MTKKKNTRPVYNAEFKAAAVAKCREIGVLPTSRELGVTPTTLRSWMKMAAVGSDAKAQGKPSYEDLEKEVRRLRKEIGYIQEINSVLKKSTAIFSHRELGDLR